MAVTLGTKVLASLSARIRDAHRDLDRCVAIARLWAADLMRIAKVPRPRAHAERLRAGLIGSQLPANALGQVYDALFVHTHDTAPTHNPLSPHSKERFPSSAIAQVKHSPEAGRAWPK